VSDLTHEEKIIHLLRRTGFGVTKEKVQQFSGFSIEEMVDRLLDQGPLIHKPLIDLTTTGQNELIYWWYSHILTTSNTLEEKMTLFWHNHFTSSIVVCGAYPMANQNVLLRKHALGNFKTFLYDIAIDPAMLLYLNNRSNGKKAPNENFAREFLELFTLGVDHYTQDDVKNAARSFTGWRYNDRSHTVYEDPNAHDEGVKTLLSRRGNYDLEDVVRVVTSSTHCADFVTRKFWNKFVYPSPSESDIRDVSNRFYDSGMNIKVLLKETFTSDAFYSEKAQRSIIKDPTEFVIELMRNVPSYELSTNDLNVFPQMNLLLMKPPNVGGWGEGVNWLSSSFLLARGSFAAKVTNTATYESLGLTKSMNKASFLDQLLDITGMFDITPPTKSKLLAYAETTSDATVLLRGLLYLIFMSPEAQLK
jgi:uncharacterized protein (DUF1800 family)